MHACVSTYVCIHVYVYKHISCRHNDCTPIPGPRHLDSQSTVGLNEKASPNKAAMLCGAVLKHGLLDADATDGENPPRKLLDYIFRNGVVTVQNMDEVTRAAEVLRWTRAIGSMQSYDFEQLDPEHGYMAKVLHGFATDLSKQQAVVEQASKEYQKSAKIITDLGEKKRGQLDLSMDTHKLQVLLDKINSWVEVKATREPGQGHGRAGQGDPVRDVLRCVPDGYPGCCGTRV